MISEVIYDNKKYSLEYEEILPSVYVYKNVILKEWDSINRIEAALKKEGTRFSWQSAKVGYGQEMLDHRKCVDFKINEKILLPNDEYSEDMINLYKQINTSLRVVLEHYKPQNYLNEISFFECINIVRYGSGEYFNVHTDDQDSYRCTVSAVGYPNDDYSGGELRFAKFDLKYKPVAGDLVVFPSAYSYAHSSEPVVGDAVKYSFVMMTDRTEGSHKEDSPIYSYLNKNN